MDENKKKKASLSSASTYISSPPEAKEKASLTSGKKNSGSGLGYVAGNLGLGLTGILEGAYNFIKGGTSSIFGGEQGNRYAAYLFGNGTESQKLTQELNKAYNPGGFMKFAGEAAQGIGQSSVFYLNATGAPIGTVIFFTGAAGNSISEAVARTGKLGWREYGYGILSGATEGALELLSGAAGAGLGKAGKTITGTLEKTLGKVGKDTAKQAVRNGVAKSIISGAAGEFFEEFLGEYADVLWQRSMQIDPNASTTFADALYAGLVGAASGGIMEGVQTSVRATFSHTQGSKIIAEGKADALVSTVKTMQEQVKSKDWSKYFKSEEKGDVRGIINNLVAAYQAYENLPADKKTGDYAKVFLGEMQSNLAILEAVIGRTAIEERISDNAEKYVQYAEQIRGEKFTAEDIRSNKNGIRTQLALARWAFQFNDVETVGEHKRRWVAQQIEQQMRRGVDTTETDIGAQGGSQTILNRAGVTESGIEWSENDDGGALTRIYNLGNDRMVIATEYGDGEWVMAAGNGETLLSDDGENIATRVKTAELDKVVTEIRDNYDAIVEKATAEREKKAEAPEENSGSEKELRQKAPKTGKPIAGADNVMYATEGDLKDARLDPGKLVKSKLSIKQKATITLLSKYLEAGGYRVLLFEGNGRGANGAYRGNTIYLDINAKILRVAAHELVHSFKAKSPDMYTRIRDFIVEKEFDNDQAKLDEAIKDITKLYAENGEELKPEVAEEEIIAKSCEKVFGSVEALRSMFDTDKELFHSANAFLGTMQAFFRSIIDSYGATNEYAAAMEKSAEDLEELRARFAEAMQASLKADQTPRNAGESDVFKSINRDDALGEVYRIGDGEMTVAENVDEDKVFYSFETYDNGGREKLAQVLKDQGYSKAEIKAAMEPIERMSEVLRRLADEYEVSYGALKDNLYATVATDITGTRQILSTLVSNGEYPVNLDLQLICKKRVAYMELMARLLEDGVFGQVKYDGDAIAMINEILSMNGYETACLGCFVESRRQMLQKWAETIVQEWNDEVKKRNPDATYFPFALDSGKTISAEEMVQLEAELSKLEKNDLGNVKLAASKVKDKMGELLDKAPSLGHLLTADTILTPDGLKALQATAGGKTLVSLVKQRYGTASPKLVQEFNPYNSELADLTFENAKKITGNSVTGAGAYLSRAKEVYGKKPTKRKSETDAQYEKRVSKWEREVNEWAVQQYLFDIGGARIQSFSDFMIENVFDYFQIMGDLAAKGFPLHGYTKEIVCARLFGQTGAKWNGSLIATLSKDKTTPAGLISEDEYESWKKDGKIPEGLECIKVTGRDGRTWYIGFDDFARNKATKGIGKQTYIQSIGMKDIMSLILDPRYSGNVGNITIGVSDEQIIAMLRSPYFRMVIPYHLSGMGKDFAIRTGVDAYTDYTAYQNTRIGQLYDKKGNPVDSLGLSADELKKQIESFNFNARLRELGDARAVAAEYIAWCRNQRHEIRDGKKVIGYAEYLPKFSGSEDGKYYDFTQEENYYKLLEDFNVYDAIDELKGVRTPAPQEAVKMVFPGDKGRKLTKKELDAYRARLKKVEIYTEADIEKIIERANWTTEQIIEHELEGRAAYKAKADANWESTVSLIETALMTRKRLDQFRTVDEFEEMAASKSNNVKQQMLTIRPVNGTYRVEDTLRKSFNLADARYSISSDEDREYMSAVESGNERKQEKLVKAAAERAGYTTPMLFHGTPRFGFTTFDPYLYSPRSPYIYTSSKSNVSANYAGNNHYAARRDIGRKYRTGDSLADIITNAETIWGKKYHEATEEERKSRYDAVVEEATKVADKIDELYVDIEYPNDDIMNAAAWVANLMFDARDYDKYFDAESEEERRVIRENWEYDIRRYNENKAKLKTWYEENRQNLTPEQRKYVYYLLSYDVGDAAIDIEYSLQRAISDGRILAGEDGSLADADELKESMDEIHKIGSYQLYGDLGSNPFEFDANGGQFWALKVPEMGEGYYDTDEVCKWAKENGYTSVIMRNIYDYGEKADNYVFFEPNQVKSADNITYDDDGNVIPLSERFNREKDDIRYSFVGTAYLTEERVDNYLKSYAIPDLPTRSQAWIARMDPKGFVPGTTDVIWRSRIYADVEPLDVERLRAESQPMFFDVELDENGKPTEIVGHEGRHRATALGNEGIWKTPVLLFDYGNWEDNRDSYEHIMIYGQGRGTDPVFVYDVIPLDYAHRDEILKTFSEPTYEDRLREKYGKDILRYSIPGEEGETKELIYTAEEQDEARDYVSNFDAYDPDTKISVLEFLRSAKGTKADKKTLRTVSNIIAASNDLDVRFADTEEKGVYIRGESGQQLILLDSKLESAAAIRKTLSAEMIHMAEQNAEGYDKFAKLVLAVTSPEEKEEVRKKYKEYWKSVGREISDEALLHECVSELGSNLIQDYDLVSEWANKDRRFAVRLLDAARSLARSLFGKDKEAYRQAATMTAMLADALTGRAASNEGPVIQYRLGEKNAKPVSEREKLQDQARAIHYFTLPRSRQLVNEWIETLIKPYFTEGSGSPYVPTIAPRDLSLKPLNIPTGTALRVRGLDGIVRALYDGFYTAETTREAKKTAEFVADSILNKTYLGDTDISVNEAVKSKDAALAIGIRSALRDKIYDALTGGEAQSAVDSIRVRYENLMKGLEAEAKRRESDLERRIGEAQGIMKATLQAIEQISRARRQYRDGYYRYQGTLAAPEIKLLTDAVIAAKSRGGYLTPEGVRRALIAFNDVFRIEQLRADLNEEYEVMGMNVETIKDLDYTVNQIARDYDVKDDSKMQAPLTAAEIETFADVARATAQLYRTYNKYWDEKRKTWIDADETAKRAIDIVEATERLREADPKLIKRMREIINKYGIEALDPLAVSRLLDGYDDDGVMTEIITDVMNAENAKTLRIQNYMREVDNFIKSTKGFEKHLTSEEDMVEYRGEKLTRDEFIQLYMTTFRKQALLHLGLGRMEFGTVGSKYGLRVIAPYIQAAQEATGSTEKVESPTIEDLQTESEKVVREIRALADKVLTPDDRKYIELMERFYNEVSTKDKRETDYKYFGMTNIEDDPKDKYVPIVTSSSSRASSITDERTAMLDFATLAGQSFNKNTVRGAKNPLSITGAYGLMQKHANGLAAYVELYAAMQKLDRIWSTDINHNKQNSKRLRDVLKNAYGENVEKYVRNLMGDIQGINAKRPNAFNAIINRMRSNYAIFQLGANPKTWFNQLGSMGALYRFCDLDSITKGLIPTNLDKMAQYSTAAAIRVDSDVAVKAQTLTSQVTGRVKDVLMKPIGWADMKIVGASWGACQYQIQKETGYAIGSEENLRLAGQLLNRVINESQDTSLASTKTGIARSDNELIRSLAMFRSAPFKQYSRMTDAIGTLSILSAKKKAGQEVSAEKIAKAKKELARTGAGWALQAAIGVAISLLFNWLYDKDKEVTAKDVALDYSSELISVVPLVGDLYNYIVSGYDLSYFAFDMLNDGLAAMQNTAKVVGRGISGDNVSRQDIAKMLDKDATVIGQFTGIPTRNVKNALVGITKRLSSIFGGSLGYRIDAARYSQSYQSDLQKALEDGNDRLAETIVELLYSDKKATSEASEAVVDEVVRLYGEGYKNVLPSTVSSTVTVDGIEYDMTAKDQKRIRAVANEADRVITGMISTDIYKGLDDADRAKAIGKIYDVYYDRALNEVFGVPMTKADAISRLGDEATIFAAAAHVANIESDKDANGKTITNSRKNKVNEYLASLGLDLDTLSLILYASGYSSDALKKQVSSVAATADLDADTYADVYGALGLASS